MVKNSVLCRQQRPPHSPRTHHTPFHIFLQHTPLLYPSLEQWDSFQSMGSHNHHQLAIPHDRLYMNLWKVKCIWNSKCVSVFFFAHTIRLTLTLDSSIFRMVAVMNTKFTSRAVINRALTSIALDILQVNVTLALSKVG